MEVLEICNFKEMFERYFLKDTTTSRERDKVNKIVPIMQAFLAGWWADEWDFDEIGEYLG